MDRPARVAILVGLYAAGVLCLVAAGYLVYEGATYGRYKPGLRLFDCVLASLLLGSALYLFFRGSSLVLSDRPDAESGDHIEARVARLGLPTAPDAYRDGGVSVAATAPTLDEAELIAAVLRGADVPAWVEGAAASAWYWHMQYAMHPGGMRVLVPAGRLADAKQILSEQRADAAEAAGASPKEEEEDRAYYLYRRARGLAYLLLLGIVAPITFVLALVLLHKIRQERAASGPSEWLTKAHRLTVLVVVFSMPLWGAVGGVIGLALIGSRGLP